MYVGFRQANAAIAQAKAADAQAVAATAQSDTARMQFDLSVKQLYAGLSSSDAATRPLLKIAIPQLERMIDLTVRDVTCAISNCGLGPALDLAAFYGDDPVEAAGLYGEFVGVDDLKKES